MSSTCSISCTSQCDCLLEIDKGYVAVLGIVITLIYHSCSRFGQGSGIILVDGMFHNWNTCLICQKTIDPVLTCHACPVAASTSIMTMATWLATASAGLHFFECIYAYIIVWVEMHLLGELFRLNEIALTPCADCRHHW